MERKEQKKKEKTSKGTSYIKLFTVAIIVAVGGLLLMKVLADSESRVDY